MKKAAAILLSVGMILSSFSVALAEDGTSSSSPKPFRLELRTGLNEVKEEAKTNSCDVRMKAVQMRSSQLTKRAKNMEDVFAKIASRVEEFYVSKGLSVSNYQTLVDAIATKKAAVDSALTEAQNAASSFSCTDTSTAKTQVQAYRVAMQKVISALKDYRTSIKNLIVAVRTAAGKTKPSASPEATP